MVDIATESSSNKLVENDTNETSSSSSARPTSVATKTNDDGAASASSQEARKREGNLVDSHLVASHEATESKKAKKSHAAVTVLSKVQLQRVDASFERLFGYPWEGATARAATTSVDSHKLHQLLVQVLGPRKAAQVLRTKSIASSQTYPWKPQRESNPSSMTSLPMANSLETIVPRGSTRTAELSPAAEIPAHDVHSSDGAHSLTKPSVAGSEQRIPLAGSLNPTTEASAATCIRAGGVDDLLNQIKNEGKSATTVMKTALDWEQFKSQSGVLGSQLEEKAESSGAYLKQQDFLTRVDHRQFEHEKSVRDKERAARGK
jgi:Bucentaur or craniofacial development